MRGKPFYVFIIISLVLHLALLSYLSQVKSKGQRRAVIPIWLTLAAPPAIPSNTWQKPGTESKPFTKSQAQKADNKPNQATQDFPRSFQEAPPRVENQASNTSLVNPMGKHVDAPGGEENSPEIGEGAEQGGVQNASLGGVTGGARDDSFNSVPVIIKARPVREILFDYPPISRDLGEEGEVTVFFKIDKNGRVFDMRIKESSGFYRLDRVVIQYLKGMQYEPTTRDGVPVITEIEDTYVFSLKRGAQRTGSYRKEDTRWRILE